MFSDQKYILEYIFHNILIHFGSHISKCTEINTLWIIRCRIYFVKFKNAYQNIQFKMYFFIDKLSLSLIRFNPTTWNWFHLYTSLYSFLWNRIFPINYSFCQETKIIIENSKEYS